MNITEAEFDALEYVASVGHVATHDGPHISSLLERLRPFAKRETDSPQPVAWLAFATDGSESSAVYIMREQAQAAADEWGWSIAPLYATPNTPSTPSEGSVHEERTSQPVPLMSDIAYEAAENLSAVRKTFEQWSRGTADVLHRLARHIELLEDEK